MTDAKSAWQDTSEQLTALGSKLGAHFERQHGSEGANARAQTEEAFKRLGGAIQEAFDAVGTAAKDEAVRQDVKQVGRSLVTALDVTFREVSDEVRKAFDRKSADSATQDRPTQDRPTQDRPTQDRPTQDPPIQDPPAPPHDL